MGRRISRLVLIPVFIQTERNMRKMIMSTIIVVPKMRMELVRNNLDYI